MSDAGVGHGQAKSLASGSLNAFTIAFMVLAVAAPIGAISGPVILGMVLGNGVGIVGTLLVIAILIAIFAVGYGAISKHVRQAGAFYSYVQRGLGREAGGAAALIALLTYLAAFCAVTGGFGFFGSLGLAVIFGLEVPWWVLSLLALVIVGIIGQQHVRWSSSLLLVLIVFELGIFVLLDVAIIAQRGLGAFSFEVFAPSTVFSPGFAIAAMFAVFTFAGIEVAAIYSEETRGTGSSVSRATFGAIGMVSAFYILTMWCLVSAFDDPVAVASEAPGDYVFAVAVVTVGEWAGNALLVLIVLSLFASLVALHQSLSRYAFALARDSMLPKALSVVNRRNQAPGRASATQVIFVMIIIAIYAILQADPLLTLVTSLGGVATVGTLTLWVLASLSIIVYFRRKESGGVMQTLVAPLVAVVSLGTLLVLTVANYALVTGVDITIINLLWVAVPLVAGIGVLQVLWLRSHRRATYDQLGLRSEADLLANSTKG